MGVVYMHIGIAKTGSTYLQKEVLPLLSSVRYIGKPKSDLVTSKRPWDGILNRFFQCSPVIWDDLGDQLIFELFGKNDTPNSNQDILISDENVYDHPGPILFGNHLSKLANMLEEKRGYSLRILCSVRKQATRLASGYAQISDRRIGASQSDFETTTVQKVDNDYYKEGIRFNYRILQKILADVAGSENVLMLPYELMKEDLQDFLNRWFRFMNRPEEGKRIVKRLEANSDTAERNVRSSSEKTWRLRDRTLRGAKSIHLRPVGLFTRLGLPVRIPLRWPDFNREDQICLTSQLEKKIMSIYEESNRAFAQQIEMDLSEYGYY